DLERRIAIQANRSQQEQPFSIAFNALRQMLYQDHPNAISSLGTEETVAQLTQEDLQIYHQAHFRPDNMVVAIAGRISPEQALERIESAFGDWPMPETKLSQPELPEVISNPQQSIISQATQQSVILLGYLASSVYQDDYSALKLLSTYLGIGLSSRLFVELREKRGLAYDVSAFFPTRLDPSHFVTYIGTAPENTETATEGLHREVKRLVAAPLSDQELQVAKNKLLGQYALGKQTNGQLAQIYGWYETLGLGIEFDTQFQSEIAQVTPETAHSVARRYFDRDPYLSIIGPDLSHADPTC
ncbi:MAG: M16 family metallopeptidase, partial [Microcoleaceae cyanobacterium]